MPSAGSGAGDSRSSGSAVGNQHRPTDKGTGNRPRPSSTPPRLPASGLSSGREVRNPPASGHTAASSSLGHLAARRPVIAEPRPPFPALLPPPIEGPL